MVGTCKTPEIYLIDSEAFNYISGILSNSTHTRSITSVKKLLVHQHGGCLLFSFVFRKVISHEKALLQAHYTSKFHMPLLKILPASNQFSSVTKNTHICILKLVHIGVWLYTRQYRRY